MKRSEENRVRKEREEVERIEKEKQELEKKLLEVQTKKYRKMSDLPIEPAPNADGAIVLAFRLPNGNRVTRRFLRAEKLQVSYCS